MNSIEFFACSILALEKVESGLRLKLNIFVNISESKFSNPYAVIVPNLNNLP